MQRAVHLWNGYVTNITVNILDGERVVAAYHAHYQVERSFRMAKSIFFGIITRQAIRRGTRCHPFVWTPTPSSRERTVNSDTRH